MKNECGIIKDLLPLYAENIASPETVEFVEEHLKTCEACREEYERIKEPKPINPDEHQEELSAAPLLEIRRKMRVKRIQTVAVTAILVITLLVSAFAFVTAPEYIPYSDDPVTVTEIGALTTSSIITDLDGEVTYDLHTGKPSDVEVSFSRKVEGYYFDCFHETDDSGHKYYYISAYTSIWFKWFPNHIAGSFHFSEDPSSITIYYASNNGSEDVCIYGEPLEGVDSVTSLPRIALGYYLMIAIAFFGFLLAARIIFRKKENIKVWIERIMFYPLSYAIAHLLVVGYSFVTYSLTRDFLLIILISILLWSGMLFAQRVIRTRKEIKEISQALDE